jgi:hypothetical protein
LGFKHQYSDSNKHFEKSNINSEIQINGFRIQISLFGIEISILRLKYQDLNTNKKKNSNMNILIQIIFFRFEIGNLYSNNKNLK